MEILPVRVAGIVFWGLMAIGFLIAVVMLNGREAQIRQRQQAVADRFMADLYRHLDRPGSTDSTELSALVSRLVRRSGGDILSVLLSADGPRVRYGSPVPDGASYTRRLWLDSGPGRPLTHASAVVQMPSIEGQLAGARKGW